MNRFIVATGLLALFGGPALGQPLYQPNQSPVSPYLNLLRPGNSPGFNYYGLVKPQLQFQNDIMSLQQQVANNRTSITDLNSQLTPTSGHSTYFQTTGAYYPNRSISFGTGGARPNGANRGPTQSNTMSQIPQMSGANFGQISQPPR
jgi:hypothetical protein